ncbi:MAG TPA: tetratricopeptide repeat protein [Planktothrix sp.]|jgi:hypothetical protein
MHDSLWDHYDKLAIEALNQRRYTKASRLTKDALHRATLMCELQPELVQRADYLAKVHSDSGDYMSAAAIYRLILELQRATLGSEHPDVEQSSKVLLEALMNSGCITPGHA